MEIISKVLTRIVWTVGTAKNIVNIVPGSRYYRTLDIENEQVKGQLDALIDAGLIRVQGYPPKKKTGSLTILSVEEIADVRGTDQPVAKPRKGRAANKSAGGISDTGNADKADAEAHDPGGECCEMAE